MSYWVVSLLSARNQSQTSRRWIRRARRLNPSQMTARLPRLLTSTFTGKVTCVYPNAAPPGPRRILCLTAMPTQTPRSPTGPGRTIQIPRSSPWRQTRSLSHPPAAPNLQRTSLDLPLGGLRGTPSRLRGTATSHLVHTWALSVEADKESIWGRIKEDL